MGKSLKQDSASWCLRWNVSKSSELRDLSCCIHCHKMSQFFPRLQDIAPLWCGSPVMPACCGSSHTSIMASWCSTAVAALWCSSGIMLSCCSDLHMAMCPAQGSTVPGPTRTVCQISSSWSALCRPTPPLHLPGMPLHHSLILQELKNYNGCRDMYKSYAWICFYL